ncbi:MAG: hypothetical protein IT250_08225 [Chitinophagaceae bacterium]|nr:hypothetical protein [Chitinophagaceae bacterium]
MNKQIVWLKESLEDRLETVIKERWEKEWRRWLNKVDTIVKKLLTKGRKVLFRIPTVYDRRVKTSAVNTYGVNDNRTKCAAHPESLSKKYKLSPADFRNKFLQQQ